MTPEEREALEALRAVVWALERAEQRCLAVGYGGEVSGALVDARRSLAYAVAVVEERT